MPLAHEEIPPVTQEYIDNHPEIEGLRVGMPLPDAPQKMVRELIANKDEVANGAEPKIVNSPVAALDDTGAIEKVTKQRSDKEGVLLYTIRRQGAPDKILEVAANSELAFELDQRINNQDALSPQESSNLRAEEPQGEEFQVFDSAGNFARAYNPVDHAEKAEELANQFAAKISGTVKHVGQPAEAPAPAPEPEVQVVQETVQVAQVAPVEVAPDAPTFPPTPVQTVAPEVPVTEPAANDATPPLTEASQIPQAPETPAQPAETPPVQHIDPEVPTIHNTEQPVVQPDPSVETNNQPNE